MYNNLTKEQKEKYQTYCDNKFGNSFTKSVTGEPMYFDQFFNLIDTKIIFDLLFNNNYN